MNANERKKSQAGTSVLLAIRKINEVSVYE